MTKTKCNIKNKKKTALKQAVFLFFTAHFKKITCGGSYV